MKIEIPISKQSENYIKETFSQYKEIKKCPQKLKGRTIIHIYPKEDTMLNGKENLTGYKDAYNCELHIYNTDKMTVYKTPAIHDQIEIEVPCRVRIFKDLSTTIIINAPIEICYTKSCSIWEISIWEVKEN